LAHHAVTRRSFLQTAACCTAALAGAGLGAAIPEWLERLGGGTGGAAWAADGLPDLLRSAPRARYWASTASAGVSCFDCHAPGSVSPDEPFAHEGVPVKCGLCAQECLIAEGERGRCHTRMNVKGELRSLVYGRPIAVHVDPIEKKPFYHFLPGRLAYSLATAGCPLSCKFCQNWEISQARPEDHDSRFVRPEEIVRSAQARSAPIIAFTYNEPTVFTEYLTDIARAARPTGLRSVLVSCGFMVEAPLTEMCEVLDAIKIDLKGFSESFYRDVCSAELQPVLRSIRQVARSGKHLEIVNLVVPTLNDSDAMLVQLAEWVVSEAGPDVPVHFTRFHPDYQLRNLPPTPVATLERARAIALDRGIHYAYVGNVPGHPGNNTYCPACGELLIERRGFLIEENRIRDGKCDKCGQEIAGVWS
jgi:pyruvate formate lyase activating enzyme